MSPGTLVRRSLWHHLGSHLAVMLGAATACAVLTGALLVGDSMRASLRANALSGLGSFTHAVQTPGFFGADLGERIAATREYAEIFRPPAVAIVTNGAVLNPKTRALAAGAQILGVDALFWRGDPQVAPELLEPPPERSVVLNEELARELGVNVGEEVVVRVGHSSDISSDTLLGNREDRSVEIRLAVSRVIPSAGLGAFALVTRQATPRNAYMRLDALQRLMHRRGQSNTLLVTARASEPSEAAGSLLDQALSSVAKLRDQGLLLRPGGDNACLVLESEGLLLPPTAEQAAIGAAGTIEADVVPVIAYLANSIRLEPGAGSAPAAEPAPRIEVPYSVVVAIPPAGPPLEQMEARGAGERANGTFAVPDAESANETFAVPEAEGANRMFALRAVGEIVLNSWTAEQLGAAVGDRVTLEYYVTSGGLSDGGELKTERATFRLAGVVALAGAAADPTFTPEYEGITDAKRLTDWDPPFPVDLRRIKPDDERYWEEHRTAPKAFLHLLDGERLFATEAEFLGRYSSIRLYPREGAATPEFRARVEAELLARLPSRAAGLYGRDLRAEASEASRGATDFGGLFLGFSFFLIASAALLMALLFRLGMEQRAAQIGLLLAVGLSRSLVMWALAFEGVLVAVVGTLLGLPLAVAYAALMLHGLKTWWAAAVQAPFLTLHVPWTTLAVGATASLLVATIATFVSLRGLTRHSPRALLAGQLGGDLLRRPRHCSQSSGTAVAAICAAGALGLVLASMGGFMGRTGAFFGAGALALVSAVFVCRLLVAPTSSRPEGRGSEAVLTLPRLAFSNLGRNPGRSTATLSLLATAAFLLTALQAFRLRPPNENEVKSGAGGFAFVAQSSVPVVTDLNTPEGRAAAGLAAGTDAVLDQVRLWPLRLRDGDEASCRSLYVARQPRIVAASNEFMARGGFAFAASVAKTAAAKANPWLLLETPLENGAVPAIGDEAAVRWQLHSGLGQQLEILDDNGQPQRLEFVALLAGSVLQSELIVGEGDFRRLFPRIDGDQFFLIERAGEDSSVSTGDLERALAPLAADARRTSERLAEYFAVQNTYLTTFQVLGSFGLLLGTLGLAAVMLRNVHERRRELALLQAVGWERARVAALVFRENLVLVVLGMLAGLGPAAIAILPALRERQQTPAWLPLIALLAAVLAAGCVAGLVALRSVFRMRLVAGLRSE